MRPPWESISFRWGHESIRAKWDRLVLQNGIHRSRWFTEVTGSEQLVLVVPEAWRQDIIKMVHSDPGLGHFGVKKTVGRLRRAYWPSMTSSLSKYCEGCERYQARKQPVKTSEVFRSGLPNERVQIDTVGPLTESHYLKKYLTVMTDCFTKWAKVYPFRRPTAVEVAKAVQLGVMKILHSDQEAQFEVAVTKQLCQKLGILKTRTTINHAKSDGQAERLNRTLMEILSKYVHHSQKNGMNLFE